MPQNVWLALVLRDMLDQFLLLQSTVQFYSALGKTLCGAERGLQSEAVHGF